MSPFKWCSLHIFWIIFQMVFTLVGPYPESVQGSYPNLINIPRLHPSKNPNCISRWSAYKDVHVKYPQFKYKRRVPEATANTESSIQIKAVLGPCYKSSANIGQYQNERQGKGAKKCQHNVVITMKLHNIGKMKTQEEFVVIDHILDPVTMDKIRLLNPYVIKIRQEAILQLYGLRFQGVVNAEAREEVINKNRPNFTGCNDGMENPTCGHMLLHGEPIPDSQGFCCSCDDRKNVRQRDGILNEFTGNFYSDRGPNCEDSANKSCNRLDPRTAYVNIVDNSQTPRRVHEEQLYRSKTRSEDVHEGGEKHGARSSDRPVSIASVLPKKEYDTRDQKLMTNVPLSSTSCTPSLDKKLHREATFISIEDGHTKHEVPSTDGHVSIPSVLLKNGQDTRAEKSTDSYEPFSSRTSAASFGKSLLKGATYIAYPKSRAKHDVRGVDGHVSITRVPTENEKDIRDKKFMAPYDSSPSTNSSISFGKKLQCKVATSTTEMSEAPKQVYMTNDMLPILRNVLFNTTSSEGKIEAYEDAIRERALKEENAVARTEDSKLAKTFQRNEDSKNTGTSHVARKSDESDSAENGREYDRLAVYSEPDINLRGRNLIADRTMSKGERDAFKKMKSVKETVEASSDNKPNENTFEVRKWMKYETHFLDRINQDAPNKSTEAPSTSISKSSRTGDYIRGVTLSESEERAWSSRKNIIPGNVRMEEDEEDSFPDSRSAAGEESFANSRKEQNSAPEMAITRPNAILRSSIRDLRDDQLRDLADHRNASTLARISAATFDIANGAPRLLPEDPMLRGNSAQNESSQRGRQISSDEPIREALIMSRNSVTAEESSSETPIWRGPHLSTRSVRIESRTKDAVDLNASKLQGSFVNGSTAKSRPISPAMVASISRKTHNSFDYGKKRMNKYKSVDTKTHNPKDSLKDLRYGHEATNERVKSFSTKNGRALQQKQKATLTRSSNFDKTTRHNNQLSNPLKFKAKYGLMNQRFSSDPKSTSRKKSLSRRLRRGDRAVLRPKYRGRADYVSISSALESNDVNRQRRSIDRVRNSETRLAVSVDIASPAAGRYKDRYAASRPVSDPHYVHSNGKVGRGQRENSETRHPGPPYNMQISSEDNAARTKSYSEYETRESMPASDFEVNVNSTFADPYCAAAPESVSPLVAQIYDNPFYGGKDERRSSVDKQIEEKFKRISNALKEASTESNIDRGNTSAGQTRNEAVLRKFVIVPGHISNEIVSQRQWERDQVAQFMDTKFIADRASTLAIEATGRPNESTVGEIDVGSNSENIRESTEISTQMRDLSKPTQAEKPLIIVDRFQIASVPIALNREQAILKDEKITNVPTFSRVTDRPVQAIRTPVISIDHFQTAKRPLETQPIITGIERTTDLFLGEKTNDDRKKLSRHSDHNTSFTTTISDPRTFEESSKRPLALRTNMPATVASSRGASFSKNHSPPVPFRSYFQKRLHDISRARHGQRIRSHLPSAFLPDLKGSLDIGLTAKNKKNGRSVLDNAGLAPGLPTDYRPTEKDTIGTIEMERLRSTTGESLSEITGDDVSPTESQTTATMAESSTWQTTRITDQNFRPLARPVQLFVPSRTKIVLSIDELTLEDEVDSSTETGPTVPVMFSVQKSSNVASEDPKIGPKFHVHSLRDSKFPQGARSMLDESSATEIVVRSPKQWANALPIASPSARTTVSEDLARMRKLGGNLCELRKLSKVDHETTRRAVSLLAPPSVDSARSKAPREDNFYSDYRMSSNKYGTNNMPEEIFSATDVSDGAMEKFYANDGNAKHSKSNTGKLDSGEMAKLPVPLRSSELRKENMSGPNIVEGFLERIHQTEDSSKDLLLGHARVAFSERPEGTENAYTGMDEKTVKSKYMKEKERNVVVRKRNEDKDATNDHNLDTMSSIAAYEFPTFYALSEQNENNDHPWTMTTDPSELLKNILFNLSQVTNDGSFNSPSFTELNADLLPRTIDEINFALENPNVFLRKYNLSPEMKLALLRKLRRSDAFANFFDPPEDTADSAVDNSKINGEVDPANVDVFLSLSVTFPSERQIGYHDRLPEDTYSQYAATNPTFAFNPTDNPPLFENNYADFNYNDASDEYGVIRRIKRNSFGAENGAISDVSANENGLGAAEEFRLRRCNSEAGVNATEQRESSPAESNPASYRRDGAPNLAEITGPFTQLEKKILPGKLYYDGSRSAPRPRRGRDKLLKSTSEATLRRDNDEKMIENEVTMGITRNDAPYATKNFTETILPARPGSPGNRQKDSTSKISPRRVGVWSANDVLKGKNAQSRVGENKSRGIYDAGGGNVWKRKFERTFNESDDHYGPNVDLKEVQHNQVRYNSMSEFDYSLPKRSFDPPSSFGKKDEEGNLVFMNGKVRFLTDLADRGIENRRSDRLIGHSKCDVQKVTKDNSIVNESIDSKRVHDNDDKSKYRNDNIKSFNVAEGLKGNLRRLLSIQMGPSRPSEPAEQSILTGSIYKRQLLNQNYQFAESDNTNRIKNPSQNNYEENSYNEQQPTELKRDQLQKSTDHATCFNPEETHIIDHQNSHSSEPAVNPDEVSKRSDGSFAKKIDKSSNLPEIGLLSNFKNVADELDGTSAFNELSSEKRFHSEIGYSPTPDNKGTDVHVGSGADFQSGTDCETAVGGNLLGTEDIKSAIGTRAKYLDEEALPASWKNKYPIDRSAEARASIVNELGKDRDERPGMNRSTFHEEPRHNEVKRLQNNPNISAFKEKQNTYNSDNVNKVADMDTQLNPVINKQYSDNDFDITLRGKLHVQSGLSELPRSINIHSVPDQNLREKSDNGYSTYGRSNTLKTSNDISKEVRSNGAPGARLFSHVFNIESVPDAFADTADTIGSETGIGAPVSHNIHDKNSYGRERKNVELTMNPIEKLSIRGSKYLRNTRESVRSNASNDFAKAKRRPTSNRANKINYSKCKSSKTTTQTAPKYPKIFYNNRLTSSLGETRKNWVENRSSVDSKSNEINRSSLNVSNSKNVGGVPLLRIKIEGKAPNIMQRAVTANNSHSDAEKCYKMTTVLQRMDIPLTTKPQKSVQDEQVSTIDQLYTETTISEQLNPANTVQFRSNSTHTTSSIPNHYTHNEENTTELPTDAVTNKFSNQLQNTGNRENMSNEIRAKNILAIMDFIKRFNNIMGNGMSDNPQAEVNELAIHIDRFVITPHNESDASQDYCKNCATEKVIIIGEGVKHNPYEKEAKRDDTKDREWKSPKISQNDIDTHFSSAKEPKKKLIPSGDNDRSIPLKTSFESPVYASSLLGTVKGGFGENPSIAVNSPPKESAHASTLLRSDYHPGGREEDKSFLFHANEDRHGKSTVNGTDNSAPHTLRFMQTQRISGNNVVSGSQKSNGESSFGNMKTAASNDEHFSKFQHANLTTSDTDDGLKDTKTYSQASVPTGSEIMKDDPLKYNLRKEDTSQVPAERMKIFDWQGNKIKLSGGPAKSGERQVARQLEVQKEVERLDKPRRQNTTEETSGLRTIGKKTDYPPNSYDAGIEEMLLENENTFQEIRNVEPSSLTEVKRRTPMGLESRFENSAAADHGRIIKKREKTREAKKSKKKKKRRRKKKKRKKKKGMVHARHAEYTEKWRPLNRHLLAVSEHQEIPLTLTLNEDEKRPASGYLIHEYEELSGRYAESAGKRERKTSKKIKRRPRVQRQMEPDGAQIRGGQDCTDPKHPANVSQSEYSKSAHCLRFSNLWYSVYELEEPMMEHVIYLQLYEKRTLSDGSTHWNDLTRGSIVRLGTFNTHHTDDEGTIAFAYNELNTKQGYRERYLDPAKDRLLIPSTVASGSGFKNQGASGEYLVVEGGAINENGNECDKAGVGFAAFVGQANRCGRVRGTCLKNQPLAYWRHDMEARVAGQAGCYFLSNFASVPTDPIKYNVSGSGSREFLGLEYDSPHVSTIDIEVRADYNAAVKAGTLGRISEVYVDNTSPQHTVVMAVIKNTGSTASSYQLRIADCPKGLPITWTKAKSRVQIITPQLLSRVTIDIPGQLSSSEFYCSLELVNRHGEPVATRRIKIRKMDRCHCVWHCVCTCVGSDSGQGCQPMSLEHYHAAGFQGPVPVLSSDFFDLSDTVRDVLLFTLALTFLLLIMGITKWSIGLYVPIVGRWGLDAMLPSHRPCKYFESELQCRCIVTDKSGMPVHPDTRKKTVRICSRKMEFFLNLIFFMIYPVMACCSCTKNLCRNKHRRSSFSKQSKINQAPEENEDGNYICMKTYKDYRDSKIEAEDTKYVMKELRRSQESLRDYMKYEQNSYYCKRKQSPRN